MATSIVVCKVAFFLVVLLSMLPVHRCTSGVLPMLQKWVTSSRDWVLGDYITNPQSTQKTEVKTKDWYKAARKLEHQLFAMRHDPNAKHTELFVVLEKLRQLLETQRQRHTPFSGLSSGASQESIDVYSHYHRDGLRVLSVLFHRDHVHACEKAWKHASLEDKQSFLTWQVEWNWFLHFRLWQIKCKTMPPHFWVAVCKEEVQKPWNPLTHGLRLRFVMDPYTDELTPPTSSKQS